LELCSGRLKTYKNALCGPSRVFFGVANYWGQEINIILPLLGFLGLNLQWHVPTSLLVDRHNGVISAYGPPTRLLSQSNRHSGHPGTVEGTLLSFIKLHFSHIMHFYQNFDLLRLLSCHMGSPDSLSHGFYCPYQIGFTLFNISIEFRRVK
jgi:hypothetical protein